MPWRYLIGLLGLLLVLSGALSGGWGWVLAWPGGNFLLLGWAYAAQRHRILGKRSDGQLPIWSRVVFAPLLAYAWLVWHLLRLAEREPAFCAVTAGLVVGRRLLAREFPPGFDNIVDLTAEFAETPALRQAPGYICFPVLDGSAPPPEAVADAIGKLKPGRTYVHCAQGHGRSALFAAALLLQTGKAPTPEEAVRMLKAVRRGVRLNRVQRTCLNHFAALPTSRLLRTSAFRNCSD